MKKLNTVLMLTLGAMAAQAQITLTTTDMPSPGWTNVERRDSSTGAVNWGNRGANQVYNFGSFSNNQPDTVFYLTPTSNQTSAVPNATIAVTSDHVSYLLGKNSAAKFDFEGLETTIMGWNTTFPFNPVSDIYHFPSDGASPALTSLRAWSTVGWCDVRRPGSTSPVHCGRCRPWPS